MCSRERAGRPSDEAILERALSLANEAMFTVALQVRRLSSEELEDQVFVFRWWADLQFLVVALRRLQRSAAIALQVQVAAARVADALAEFELALPGLPVMRNVGEHTDAYAVDSPSRHHQFVDRRMLQVGEWDGRTYTWLRDAAGQPMRLDVQDARAAAEELFQGLSRIVKDLSQSPGGNR